VDLPARVAESAVIRMSTPHPHSAADLSLAPVLISLERNLARARDSSDLEYTLALELNDDGGWYHTAADRAGRVCRVATRDVDLHGWQVHPTGDLHGLAVEHGGYRVSLMLGKRLTEYVAQGTLTGGDGPAVPARH
jgi:hypothetical protein